jgi:hypothetical protein
MTRFMKPDGSGCNEGRAEWSDRWRWRKDRSHDGDQTWIEGVGFIEAPRSQK